MASRHSLSAKTFADAFNEHLQTTGRRVTDIARESGVDKDALYALKRGRVKNMSVDLAIKVAASFGETVEEFMGLSPPQIRDELLDEIAHLSPSERAVLMATLAALRTSKADDDAETTPAAKPVPTKGD